MIGRTCEKIRALFVEKKNANILFNNAILQVPNGKRPQLTL